MKIDDHMLLTFPFSMARARCSLSHSSINPSYQGPSSSAILQNKSQTIIYEYMNNIKQYNFLLQIMHSFFHIVSHNHMTTSFFSNICTSSFNQIKFSNNMVSHNHMHNFIICNISLYLKTLIFKTYANT